jgi:anaerobic selenocysteine-containing dehydrogenase
MPVLRTDLDHRPDEHPALLAAHARDADPAVRRAGLDPVLWVTATNPAVSLPELARIRQILAQERLFLVVSDIFLSETAQFADVVLPAATWVEKPGTFTNADRRVHLSEKAADLCQRSRISPG